MHIVENYNLINKSVQSYDKKVTLIVVSKNQDLDSINLLIKKNHFDFGENRVQEAILKWKNLMLINSQLNLHLIGKLQSNKSTINLDLQSGLYFIAIGNRVAKIKVIN